MKKSEGIDRPLAPDALGITGRTVSLSLGQALYAIAREQADEEVENANLGMWGGLLRDTDTLADQIPEAALIGDVDFKPGEIEPGELAGVGRTDCYPGH